MAKNGLTLPAQGGAADPLLAALIAKLPPTGSDWPVERQAAWLKMVAMAFGELYPAGGTPLSDLLDLPQFIGAREAAANPGAIAADGRPQPKPVPFVRMRQTPERFYIGTDNRALKDPGAVPIDVTEAAQAEMIEDMRPAGQQELDTIVWKDGTWPPGSLPSLNIVQAQAA